MEKLARRTSSQVGPPGPRQAGSGPEGAAGRGRVAWHGGPGGAPPVLAPPQPEWPSQRPVCSFRFCHLPLQGAVTNHNTPRTIRTRLSNPRRKVPTETAVVAPEAPAQMMARSASGRMAMG